MQPEIVEFKYSVDDRGMFSLFDIPLNDIKRFYIASTHKAGFVRAWHGHKIEEKYAVAVKGSVLIGIVEEKDWEEPNIIPLTFVLSESKPELLYIPKGYANGIKFLTDDARILFFSTLNTQESVEDDYRIPAHRWDIWSDKWR